MGYFGFLVFLALIGLVAIEKLNPKVQLIYCPPKSICIPNGGTVTPVPTP